MLTKTAETELIQTTINRLPDSYLRSILIAEYDSIERAIRDDIGFIDLASTIAQVVEARKELTDLQNQIRSTKKEIEGYRGDISNCLMHLRNIHDTADTILYRSSEAYKKVTA